MPSPLAHLLFAVGVVCWILLPAAVVMIVTFASRHPRPEPLWVRRCSASDPADPGAAPCWVPADEICPRHGRPSPRPYDYDDTRLSA